MSDGHLIVNMVPYGIFIRDISDREHDLILLDLILIHNLNILGSAFH